MAPAYYAAVNNSLYDFLMFCDLQLSKDGVSIRWSDLRLENSTNINLLYPNQQNSYVINGNNISRYFSIQYTVDILLNNILGEVKGVRTEQVMILF